MRKAQEYLNSSNGRYGRLRNKLSLLYNDIAERIGGDEVYADLKNLSESHSSALHSPAALVAPDQSAKGLHRLFSQVRYYSEAVVLAVSLFSQKPESLSLLEFAGFIYVFLVWTLATAKYNYLNSILSGTEGGVTIR